MCEVFWMENSGWNVCKMGEGLVEGQIREQENIVSKYFVQYRKDISYESNHVNHLCDFEKVWENFFKKNFIREETSTAITTTTSVHFVEFDYPSCRRFST